jgi:hypothetical protein
MNNPLDLQPYVVTIDKLFEHQQELLEFALLDEETIMRIWIKSGEVVINDFNDITYNFQMPLYQKMILRFRREGMSCPAVFCKTLDPSNQRLLLSRYHMYYSDVFTIVEFMAQIKVGMGLSDLTTIGFNDTVIECWKGKNSIAFFFSLSNDLQHELVSWYNSKFCY